jgi:hypothetical protein
MITALSKPLPLTLTINALSSAKSLMAPSKSLAKCSGILCQLLFHNNLQCRDSHFSGNRIASEGGAMLPRVNDAHDGFIGQDGGYRIRASRQCFS